MAEGTLIEWARHPVTGLGATWNIVTGCSVVSPGCTNCYAMKLAGTRLRNHPSRQGLTVPTRAGPVWNGEVRFNEQWLTQPLAWKKPHGIFVAAHGDLFAEGVTDDQLDRIFAVMALTPQHVYYVLSKRPERMRDYLTDRHGSGTPIDIKSPTFRHLDHGPDRLEFRISARMLDFATTGEGTWPRLPLRNVWLGVSVEDQTRADQRIPVLLDTPAAVRFISAEPLLGPIDLTDLDDGLKDGVRLTLDALTGLAHDGHDVISGIFGLPDPRIDWVIAGGESGPAARPSHPEWFRALRDQCAEVGVPFFFKQWGAWTIASEENGHYDSAMASNDAIWLDIDGRQAKPSCTGMTDPIGMFMPGKKAAGHRLDGREYFAWPEVRT